MNTNGLPLDYGTEHMNKAVVLLSDGDNTCDDVYSAYGILACTKGRIAPPPGSSTPAATTTIDNKTLTVCNSLKSNGVYVYTVALGTSISSRGKNLLSACASGPNFYFEAPTSSELQSAFSAIGDSLSSLRVSK